MAGSGGCAPGDRVGPFSIERFIAAGGIGEVYAARREGSTERVALKLLGEFSPAAAVRFDREARVLQRLDHPHIVAAREHGRTADGTPYLAMELLEGETLEAMLSRGALDPATVVTLAVQVAEALAYAHARGVVHRDLKPANVFVCRREQLVCKILDFGIARFVGERRLTATGTAIGTWAYMSPEQARGDADIDASTDVWSLGVMLYECFSGRLPFQSESAPGILFQILTASPAPLAEIAPGLPRELYALVERSLQRERAERVPGAAAVRDALASLAFERSPPPRVSPASGAATSTGPRTDESAERRLSCVVFAHQVGEPELVDKLAADLHGEVWWLAGREALVLFGVSRWDGDERSRAARFAALVAPAARAVGVATGKVQRDGRAVTGVAVDMAVAAAAGREGVWLDAATATAARHEYVIEPGDRGFVRMLPQLAARPRAPTHAGTPFVGREIETALLLRAVDTATQLERVRATVVVGAPGLGKTRLCSEALSQLQTTHASAVALVGRGEAFRKDTPFAALRAALAHLGDPSLAGLFVPGGVQGDDPVTTVDRVHAVLETVLQGVAARGPLILAIDDAQWLDPPSREALGWLAENADGLPLAMWLFTRPEGRDACANLAPGAQVTELGPLPPTASRKLLAAIAPDAPAELADRAAGHPLFLEELARLYADDGDTARERLPVSIEGALLAQFDQLPAMDREFLKRASVFGETFWVESVAHLGGTAECAPRLRRGELIVPRRNPRLAGATEFSFRNAMLRDVVYGLWPDAMRVTLHDRAGAWLSARSDASPDECARHWDLAGNAPRAAEAYVAAAEISALAADASTTTASVARALALTQDARLRWRALIARDDALSLTSDRDAQRAGLAELESLAAELGRAQQAEAARRRCYFARMAAENEIALQSGTLAAVLAETLDDPRLASAAETELAYLFASEGRRELARTHAGRALAFAERTGDPQVRARALTALAFEASESGEVLQSLEWFEQAAVGFGKSRDRRRVALANANAASLMLDLGRVEEAVVRLEEAVAASRRVGNARTAAAAQHKLGVAHRILGDHARALALQSEAAQAAAALRHERLRCAVATECVYLALARGADANELDRCAREADSISAAVRAKPLRASARAAVLRSLVRRGLDGRALASEALADIGQGARAQQCAELWIAVYEGAGRRPDDRVAAMEAVRAWTATMPTPEDGAACRRAFAKKYLVPNEIL